MERLDLGRVRLSQHFFMREMLYSEVSNVHGVPNLPENPELAIEVGKKFCSFILEPLRHAFGHVTVRSAYRSTVCNGHCHELFKKGDNASWCLDNEYNAARHTWDRCDKDGYLGATATVVVTGYIDYYERTSDWKPLAWWIRDNIENYAEVLMFRHLCAFNIRWYEGPSDKAISFLDPPTDILLTKQDMPNFAGFHRHEYEGIIPGRVSGS